MLGANYQQDTRHQSRRLLRGLEAARTIEWE
jgi:hypothetical protein